ncbi:MAG: hypothetical protein V3V74_07280 [Nitrosomonadaceae bacterium]
MKTLNQVKDNEVNISNLEAQVKDLKAKNKKAKNTIEYRTQATMSRFADCPNDQEFSLLKGVLMMANTWAYEDKKKLDALIDISAIAQRMDEINKG